ncbi:negative regulator of differentiation 1 [Colletotrichum spaethianum]|uniref:Negative regulator of differentiation 1 n=1 Tax=Colletotrichum spaethianum TaxID=700344 RepID=A0AA37P0M3_9PEZI|nr:negative regulator of differentiation 1 [Colletotrichum spaethianum]GKT43733.1 negative regulator of differentiation 1 [Colletotrichum spaethianum]
MASSVGTTVSIDRTYLDTLIRSDESNWEEDSDEQRTAAPTLSNTRNVTQLPVDQPRLTTTTAARAPRSGQDDGKLTVHQPTKQGWADAEPTAHDVSEAAISPTEAEHGFVHQEEARLPVRPQFERLATRTILISNLAEGTSHADVTDVVRGGLLLDIFLRTHDRSAQVSFLHEADARTFFEYVRRHDLYIRHKRVDVRWCDRQFTLPGHVASKVGIGATRNLVVRRCDPSLTEEGIRHDLDHIHNLIVIRVTFDGGSCHISTNSVHNALFARTCMMSRQKYKGSKIEWDADECAQPLETPQAHRVQPHVLPSKRLVNPMANRFEILKLDGDSDNEENIPPEFHPRPSMNIRV